jgi:hypothetical protein
MASRNPPLSAVASKRILNYFGDSRGAASVSARRHDQGQEWRRRPNDVAKIPSAAPLVPVAAATVVPVVSATVVSATVVSATVVPVRPSTSQGAHSIGSIGGGSGQWLEVTYKRDAKPAPATTPGIDGDASRHLTRSQLTSSVLFSVRFCCCCRRQRRRHNRHRRRRVRIRVLARLAMFARTVVVVVGADGLHDFSSSSSSLFSGDNRTTRSRQTRETIASC